eukprot:24566-Pelagococcus_subviridis.AAC.14
MRSGTNALKNWSQNAPSTKPPGAYHRHRPCLSSVRGHEEFKIGITRQFTMWITVRRDIK